MISWASNIFIYSTRRNIFQKKIEKLHARLSLLIMHPSNHGMLVTQEKKIPGNGKTPAVKFNEQHPHLDGNLQVVIVEVGDEHFFLEENCDVSILKFPKLLVLFLVESQTGNQFCFSLFILNYHLSQLIE